MESDRSNQLQEFVILFSTQLYENIKSFKFRFIIYLGNIGSIWRR
ncbi:unnamed protein product [Paramecium sonneborni]|uniref:Uncharacterized protein n=1 Tax=Paramecium sonneborni TaxID=65129 RepID=A0A8S1R0C8_9CILI|nr:unnamed protein product [Paramecium sonneborni]